MDSLAGDKDGESLVGRGDVLQGVRLAGFKPQYICLPHQVTEVLTVHLREKTNVSIAWAAGHLVDHLGFSCFNTRVIK